MSDIEIVHEPTPEPKRGPWVNANGRGKMEFTVRFLKDGKEIGSAKSGPSMDEIRRRESGRI
jgi:hypothetical protein